MNLTFSEWLDYGIRLLVALFCGGLIGYERESREKPAGLRTHMLVCLGAATFGIVAMRVASRPGLGIAMDPMRILAAVIIGMGFIGGGAILHAKGTVHGLTSAAALWLVAAVGIAVGLGEISIALLVTFLSLVVLTALRAAERSKRPPSDS
jgi:putative Mg2+ transporter-C (MgtC) family protein